MTLSSVYAAAPRRCHYDDDDHDCEYEHVRWRHVRCNDLTAAGLFGQMDEDGSGTVGTDELRKVIRSMQESAGPFHKELKEDEESGN